VLFDLLGEKWCGNVTVPLSQRTMEYKDPQGCDYVFSFVDAFEIGIGYPDKWLCLLRREAVNKFIWWYLRQWAFGEWFGLRRVVWYCLLHRKVNRYLVKA